MKTFECESSSEGDEPTAYPSHAISRSLVAPPQWLRGGATGSGSHTIPWGWPQSAANALEEMKRLIAYLQGTNAAAGGAIVAPPGFDLQGFPAAAKFLQQQQQMQEDLARSVGGGGGGNNSAGGSGAGGSERSGADSDAAGTTGGSAQL